MIRRPLCLICGVFAAAVFLFVHCFAAGGTGENYPEGVRELSGRVVKKGYVLYGGEEVFSCQLREIRGAEGLSPEGVLVLFSGGGAEGFPEEYQAKLGSRIRVRGECLNFPEAENPGGFDAKRYYAIRKLSFRMREAKLLGVSHGFDGLKEALYHLRRREAGILEALLPKEEAGLLQAMLLGEKAALDSEVKGLFQRVGIIHILTISGTHISILGFGLYELLKRFRLPKEGAAVLSLVCMYLYGLMIQAESSSIRAIIMFSLFLAGKLLGRTYDLLTGLSVAAVLLLTEQPLYVLDTGFLFSFGAVFSLGFFTPLFQQRDLVRKRHAKDPPKESLVHRLFIASGVRGRLERMGRRSRDSIGALLSVSLGTLPVSTQCICSLPLCSGFLNLFVVPLAGLLITAGFWLMPAGEAALMLAPELADTLCKPLSVPVICLLKLVRGISETMDQWSFGTLFPGMSGELQVAFYYLILAALVFTRQHLSRTAKAAGIGAALCILLFRHPTGLELTALSVGQGDGIFLRSEGFCALIDGGSSSVEELAEYTLLPFLKCRGVSRLDMILITHWDADHMNGVLQLLRHPVGKRIRVGRLYLPDTGGQLYNENYEALLLAAKERGIPVGYLKQGVFMEQGKLSLSVLNPTEGYSSENLNDYSVVLHLTYGKFSALLTGDVTGEAEENLCSVCELVTLLNVRA